MKRGGRFVRGLGLTVLLAAASCAVTDSLEPSETQESAATGESHPFQSRLVCERAPGSTLVGVMYDISGATRVKVTEFSSGGNVGACELAIRASRNHRVCVPSGWSGFTVHDLSLNTNQGTFTTLAACTAVTRGSPVLRTEPGYVDFMAPAEVLPFKQVLPPSLSDPVFDAALKSEKTMWYDEASLVFAYQDSFGSPKGLRANRVGYDVGSTASEPDIHALTEYFEPQKFKFPFGIAAGSTFKENVYALYFWLPPVNATTGAAKPVRMWKNNSHWQWVFPVGTVIGEALYIQAPDDQKWFAFEVRARRREAAGWVTGVFRPYLGPAELAAAIKTKRPQWATTNEVKDLVDHLESTTALTSFTLSSVPYAAVFPAINGAMDYLPATEPALVKELLTGRAFTEAMGTHWKAEGTLESYAASTHAPFHIVPKEYPAGMFALSQNGCRNCHQQTARPLNNLDPRVVLYGEVWGEDEVFTWHPFAIDTDSFSVADGNRNVNPRLVTAGLVEWSTPASDPTTYAPLAKPYVATYE